VINAFDYESNLKTFRSYHIEMQQPLQITNTGGRPTQLLEAWSSDELFEEVEDDLCGDRRIFDEMLNGLYDCEFLEMLHCPDDQFMFKARSGLKWADIVELAEPIKKKILLSLVQNPQCFFVLFNTQRGKLKIIGSEIAQWISKYPTDRVVSYLVVSNDKTLAEQSTNGLLTSYEIEKRNVRIFELSSNNKTSFDEIKTYIDAYAYNHDYPMPLIVLLSNSKQIEKLIKILIHIKNHKNKYLKAGGGWDEADITYPPFREKNFTVNGETTNFLKILNDPNGRIIRNGFVTATEGELMGEEYEECYNAHCYPIEIDPLDQENYLSFNHQECQKHYITANTKERNNNIAERILDLNWDSHFARPLPLRDGTLYQHKIIINSDPMKSEMIKFAKKFSDKAYVLTFNMWGVTLYTNGTGKRYSTRKQNLNRLLFYIYKMNHLDDRPLIIVGRRKVDRGIGFHYAPRAGSRPINPITGVDGVLTTDGKEGLIWTDMIMGNKIDHKSTAVQKAGRGAGIVRQCPQYPGEFHYWIDESTADHIEHHNIVVDGVRNIPGTNSMLQAINHANAIIPARAQRNHDVDESTFRVVCCENDEETLKLTKEIITKVIKKETFRKPQTDESGKYRTSLNTTSEVVTLLDAVKSVPASWGTNKGTTTYRRYLPCYFDNRLYCVIPLIDPGYKFVKKIENKTIIQMLDELFGDRFKSVPKRGSIQEL
jgi:hypothetical protein